MIRRKFIAVNAYIKKYERSPTTNITLCLKRVEKKSKPNLKYKEGNIKISGPMKTLAALPNSGPTPKSSRAHFP